MEELGFRHTERGLIVINSAMPHKREKMAVVSLTPALLTPTLGTIILLITTQGRPSLPAKHEELFNKPV